MKKANYLFLLIPSLFLMTSCQTTPKIDTIDENEAIKFINDKYILTAFDAPNDQSVVKWKINADNENVRKTIGNYINTTSTPVGEVENKDVHIDSNRLEEYKNELTTDGVDFGNLGKDAVIGMNNVIYSKLYQSGQNDSDHDLIYKHGPNNGLIIISSSASQMITHTRTHVYDNLGRETEFSVVMNQGELNFTMTINFKYN